MITIDRYFIKEKDKYIGTSDDLFNLTEEVLKEIRMKTNVVNKSIKTIPIKSKVVDFNLKVHYSTYPFNKDKKNFSLFLIEDEISYEKLEKLFNKNLVFKDSCLSDKIFIYSMCEELEYYSNFFYSKKFHNKIKNILKIIFDLKIKRTKKEEKKYISQLIKENRIKIEPPIYFIGGRLELVCNFRGHFLQEELEKGDILEDDKGNKYIVLEQIVNKWWDKNDKYYVLIKDKKVLPNSYIKNEDLTYIVKYDIIDSAYDGLYRCNRICRKKKINLTKTKENIFKN